MVFSKVRDFELLRGFSQALSVKCAHQQHSRLINFGCQYYHYVKTPPLEAAWILARRAGALPSCKFQRQINVIFWR